MFTPVHPFKLRVYPSIFPPFRLRPSHLSFPSLSLSLPLPGKKICVQILLACACMGRLRSLYMADVGRLLEVLASPGGQLKVVNVVDLYSASS